MRRSCLETLESRRLLAGDTPVAESFPAGIIAADTLVEVQIADLITEFGSDTDSVLNTGSLTFGSVSIDGTGGFLQTDVGFRYEITNDDDGSLIFDTNAMAFDSLGASDSIDVSIDFTVSDGDSSDDGVLNYSVSGSGKIADEILLTFIGPVTAADGVSVAVEDDGSASKLAITAGGVLDVSDVLLSVNLSDDPQQALQDLRDDDTILLAAAFAEGAGSTATASATGFSDALSVTVGGGITTTVASALSSATAFGEGAEGAPTSAQAGANDSSDASAISGHGSLATAVADGFSSATSSAEDVSDAATLAENRSVATASASETSSSTATADNQSSATADSDNLSTSVASADVSTSATAISVDESVASADGTESSIATAFAENGSAATASASSLSDAQAIGQDSSASEATASDNSGATADAESASNATATSSLGSTSFAGATGMSSATSFAGENGTANTVADDRSISNAVAIENSAASATAMTGSDALALAVRGSAADANAIAESSSSSTAEDSSVATANAMEESTSTAIASGVSSASAFSSQSSVANAEADNASIATAVVVDESAGSATARGTSDALATATMQSAADANSDSQSSASAAAEDASVSTANAKDASTATSLAVGIGSATAVAINESVSMAAGRESSIANAFAENSSFARSVSDATADSTAIASDAGSVAEAISQDLSSTSATASTGGYSTSIAQFGSDAESSASDSGAAQAEATSQGSILQGRILPGTAIDRRDSAGFDITSGVTVSKVVLADAAMAALTAIIDSGEVLGQLDDAFDATANLMTDFGRSRPDARAIATASEGLIASSFANRGRVAHTRAGFAGASGIDASSDESRVNVDTASAITVDQNETIVLPLNISQPAEDLDFVILSGFPRGTELSQGISSAGGSTWRFNAPPTGEVMLTLPEDFAGSFNVSVRTQNTGQAKSFAEQAFVVASVAPTSLSISDVRVVETDSGIQQAELTVTRDNNDSDASVRFRTLDRTAIAGEDYIAQKDDIFFEAGGSLTKTITIDIIGDTDIEDDERFLVRLYRESGAIIEDSIGEIIVENDDQAITEGALSVGPLVVGQNTLTLTGVTPGGFAAFVLGTADGTTVYSDYGVTVAIADASVPVIAVANAEGIARAVVDLTAQQIHGQLLFQAFEIAPLQGPVSNLVRGRSAMDVDGSTQVTALDALIIVNSIQVGYSPLEGESTSARSAFSTALDVSGDGEVTALDALLVINELQRLQGSGSSDSAPLPSISAVEGAAEDDEVLSHDEALVSLF